MLKYQEVEKTIIKTYRAGLWAPFIKALKEFKMLEPNDNLMVVILGDSGSVLLAKLFEELKKHSDFLFDFTNLVVGEVPTDNLNLLNIRYQTEKFTTKEELLTYAHKNGFNKVALMSNFDDVVTTTLAELLFEGKLQTILPKEEDAEVSIIRPLFFIHKRDITRWANYNELKFLELEAKSAKFLTTHNLIKNLNSKNSLVEKNIFKSTFNVNLDKILGYTLDGQFHSFLDAFSNEGQ